MEYRKDIQGLRALAVLFVFFFHLNPSWLPGGFIGVDVFFVISGFLISSIILLKIDQNKFSIIDFYLSRIKRIIPAYYVLLIVSAIIAICLLTPIDISTFRRAFFWSTLFSSNNYFATLDTYFGASSHENLLLHTWTLAVEMQFYLFLPLILIYTKRKWLFPFILISILILISYSSYEIYFNNSKKVMYFSLLARTFEFFMGVVACLLIKEKHSSTKLNGLYLSLLGLLLLLLSAVFLNENSNFPGALAVFPCIGTLLLIIAKDNPVKKFFSSNILFFIGEISYSLYLWHWTIMAAFRYYNNRIDFTILDLIYVVLLSVIASLLSYYFVEKPLRKLKGKKLYVAVAALLIICGAITLSMVKMNRKISNVPLEYVMPSFGMKSHGDTFEKVEVLGDTLSKNSKILLLGDSHALAYKSYLDFLGKKNAFSFYTITNSTYPTIPAIPKASFESNTLYQQYLKLMDKAQIQIDQSELIIVLFTGDGLQWKSAISTFIKNLKPQQHLLFLSDFPTLDKNPIRINKGIVKDLSKLNDYKVHISYLSDSILKLIASNPNVSYLDLSKNEVFKSVPFYKDTLMYYDKGHMNAFGEKEYALATEKKFMETLNKLILKKN